MTTNESRLDRIEAILERHITQAEADHQHFQNALNETNKRAEQDRETIRAVIRELVETGEADRIALIDAVSENTERIDTLTERFNQFIENAAQDRHYQAEINQQVLSEIRRIWEYLLTQSSNGHNP